MLQPDLILWTGDINSHNVWQYTQAGNLQLMQQLTGLFTKYFSGIPIYASIGNHESVPCNMLPTNADPAQFSHDWLYDALAAQWNTFGVSAGDQQTTIKYRASYMTRPYDGLRIISLNTVYAYKMNFWLFLNDTDPDGTMTWLVQQLDAAEQQGDKVWIIGHIPNGIDVRPAWSRMFYQVVNRYESTIRGQFYGHTHYDQFQVFYDDPVARSRPTQYSYISPSLTTYSFAQPTFRMYTVDGNYAGSSYQTLKAQTFYLDLTAANAPGGVPQWMPEYEATADYKMPSLTPADWNNLINRIEADTSNALLQQYRGYFTRLPPSTCNAACKASVICTMRSSFSGDYDQCNPQRGGPTKKRVAKADFSPVLDPKGVCS